MHEDLYLDVVEPVAGVLRSTDAEEWPSVRDYLQFSLAMIAQRTIDEDVRVRWFRGPIGRALTDLAGPLETLPNSTRTGGGAGGNGTTGDGPISDGEDAVLLRSLIQGRTNEEIAQELGVDEQVVVRRLGQLFTRIGASSRAEATAFAFRERVV
jgi:DNA-binding CsgD family transcriptional regulator